MCGRRVANTDGRLEATTRRCHLDGDSAATLWYVQAVDGPRRAGQVDDRVRISVGKTSREEDHDDRRTSGLAERSFVFGDADLQDERDRGRLEQTT